MSTVLVTGGTGFLGAWVARELVAQGKRPRLFDLGPNPANLEFVEAGLPEQVEILQGDIRDTVSVEAAAEGCNAIIHLAGLMTIDCARNPILATQVNLIGSQNIFAAAAKHQIATVVYASTGGVYCPEDSRHPKPMTLYGTLKLAVEGVARVSWQGDGITSTGFRPYIVYGAGESAGIAAGPSIALRAAASSESAEIRFSGRVGFVHVTDVARAMVAALSTCTEGAQIQDLGGDYATVDAFVKELAHQRPGPAITINGAPLKLPENLEGEAISDWMEALPLTRLKEGIAITLAHWDSARDRASFTKALNEMSTK